MTPLSKEFMEKYHLVLESTILGGYHYSAVFANGYGVSVVKHEASYGHALDLWELGLTDKKGNLIYERDFLSEPAGVFGYLTLETLEHWIKVVMNY